MCDTAAFNVCNEIGLTLICCLSGRYLAQQHSRSNQKYDTDDCQHDSTGIPGKALKRCLRAIEYACGIPEGCENRRSDNEQADEIPCMRPRPALWPRAQGIERDCQNSSAEKRKASKATNYIR